MDGLADSSAATVEAGAELEARVCPEPGLTEGERGEFDRIVGMLADSGLLPYLDEMHSIPLSLLARLAHQARTKPATIGNPERAQMFSIWKELRKARPAPLRPANRPTKGAAAWGRDPGTRDMFQPNPFDEFDGPGAH